MQRRIESLETQRRRKSLVPVDAALQKQMEELRTVGLLVIRCNDLEDPAPTRPARQSTDTDYESLRALIEAPVPRRSPASEAKAANRELSQLACPLPLLGSYLVMRHRILETFGFEGIHRKFRLRVLWHLVSGPTLCPLG